MPSAHNLAKISRLVGETLPGFSMLDWELDADAFTARLGAAQSPAVKGARTLWPLLPAKLAADANHAAKEQTKAYEGFWRTTRPSSDLPGQFLHDITYVHRDADGFLRFKSGVEGFYYEGSTVMIQQQLFYFAADDAFGSISFGIINGVPRQNAHVLDGVLLTTLRDAGASPAASGIVMHRIDDLSGDAEADAETFRNLVDNQSMVAEPGSVPQEVVDHLHGAANAPGMLRVLFAQSMARGPLAAPGALGDGPKTPPELS